MMVIIEKIRWQMILISVALCVGFIYAEPLEVKIYTDVIREYNGHQDVPDGLFGVTAYSGQNILDSPGYREVIKNSGFRWVGFVGSLNWILSPNTKPQGFPESFKGWSESKEAQERLSKPVQVYGGSNVPKNLLAWSKLGIVPMLYVRGFPKWMQDPNIPPIPHYPANYDDAAIVITEYIKWIKNIYPDLEWIHIGNEPNAKWWKAKKTGRDYAELFTKVAKSIHAVYPDLKIGGPALCWGPSWPPSQNPQKPSWYTWEKWTMPLIETAGEDLDFFDFHIYSIKNPAIALEEVQAVCNAMWVQSKKRKPVIISEAGSYLTPEETANVEVHWKRRIKPWQDMIIAFIEKQPDKIVSLQMHDLIAQAGGEFRLIESDNPSDQNDFYRMFQLWGPFTGTLLRTETANPKVHCLAAVKENRLVIVLVNSVEKPQSVKLTTSDKLPVKMENKIEVRSVKVIGKDDAKENIQIAEGMQDTSKGGVLGEDYENITYNTKRQMQPLSSEPWKFVYSKYSIDRLPETISLESRETKVISVSLTEQLKPGKKFITNEWYGDKVHVPLNKQGQKISFRIDCSDISWAKAINPRLCIGMVGAHKGDNLFVKIGKMKRTIGTTWLQDLSIDSAAYDEKTKELIVVIKLLKRANPKKSPRSLRVTTVSLQVDYEK